MADILLTVGIDKERTNYEQFQKDLNDIVSKLNPPKIPVKLEIDNTAVENLRKQLTELKGLWASAGGSGKAKQTTDTLTVGSKQYFDALKKVRNLQSTIQANTEKWSKAATGKTAEDFKTYKELNVDLDNLNKSILSGTLSNTDYKRSISEIGSTATAASASIKAAGENTQTWTERVGKLSTKFGTWLSITQVIMAIVRAMKQMVSNVIEIDTAMTELKKVTNETDETYNKFLDKAASRSKKLGASLSDVVSASADFARLGYNIADAEKLADVAIIYKNVGDGIEDINTASESIIATMQGFELTADDAQSIVDKFNNIGNNFAISSGGIGEALLRSAAAMHSANNTLDETIALATAANTVVQDPDTVGTTLKTVSMYLRAAKTDAEDAGESTDGMASSVSELRKEILSLTGNQVDIQLNENEFKSTYQILKELSEVWDELSDVSQANILEMVGGKRNANIVSALIKNFSIAEDALSTSANSAGSALTENEKVLESIQGKLNILKATFEELSQTLIDKNLVIDIINLGTGLLETLNVVAQVVSAFGGLNTVLYATVAILAIIKADLIKGAIVDGFTKLIGAVKSLTTFFTKLKSAMVVYKTMTSQIKDSTSGAIVTYGQSTSALGRLSAAFKAVGISASTAQLAMGAFVAIITVVIGAISSIKNAQEEAAIAAEENLAKLKEGSKTAADTKKSVSALVEQYKVLADESNGSWNLEQAEEAKNIQTQIKDLVGGQADNLDLVNGKLDTEYQKLLNIQKILSDDEYNSAHSEYIATQEKLANGYTVKPASDRVIDGNASFYLQHAAEQLYGAEDGAVWWGEQVFGDYGGNGWLGQVDAALYYIKDYQEGLNKLKEWRKILLDAESQPGGFGYYNTSGTWVDYDTGDALSYINSKISEFESVVGDAEDAKNRFFSAKANKDVLEYLTTHNIDSQSQFDTWINDIINKLDNGEYSTDYAQALISAMQTFFPDFVIPDEIKKRLIAETNELATEIVNSIPTANKADVLNWLNGLDPTQYEAFINWWKDNSDSDVVTSGLDAMTNAFENHQKRVSAAAGNLGREQSTALSTLKTASESISVLSDAYNELSEDGYISLETLSQIQEATQLSGEEWEKYKSQLMNAEVGSAVFNQTMSDMTYTILENTFGTQGLANATEAEIAAVLRENGVMNANQVAAYYSAQAKARLAIQTKLSSDASNINIESLLNEATAYGVSRQAAAQLVAQEIVFNNTNLSVTDKINSLNQLATAFNIAKIEASGLTAALAPGGNREEFATSQGITVVKDTGRFTSSGNRDWEYVYGGVTYDDLDDAYFAKEGQKFIDRLGNTYSVIPKWTPTTPTSSSNANDALKAYLEGAEWSYKAHQNELKYINDLEWGLNNLAKTDEERFDILNDIEQARKDYADNRVKDIEHEIEMTKNLQGEEANVIDFYKEIQTVAHDEANRLRALGYTDQSDEIQEWQKTWWDAEEKIREESVKPFDNIVKRSENAISVHEIHLENAVEAGNYDGIKQYSSAAVAEYRKAQEAIHQKAEYYRSLGLEETSDEISELSTMWWDYEDKITEIIIDSYQTLVDNAKSALEEVEGIYESLISAADEYAQSGSVSTDIIKELADIGIEYVSLLKDENGQLVINKEKVDEVLKAKTQQLAIESALNYIYQIQLALEQGKTDEVARLIDTTVVATGATWDLVYATAALTNVSDEWYQKMISNINVWRSIAENSSTGVFTKDYEGQKDALDTILDLTMELIRYEAEQEIEALDKQIEKYQNIIELKKESLEETKEENDYNKEVAKKVAEIADIQSRINQLSLDDSREAAAERKALEEELAEKNNDLADYQADYAHDKQTEMLDDELEEFEKEKEKEKEIVDASVSSTEKVYQLAIDRIENDWDGLYYDIISWNYEAGSSIESEIVSAWKLASEAVQEYGSFVDAVNHFDSVETNSENSDNTIVGASQNFTYDTQEATRQRAIRSIVLEMKANSDEWLRDTSTYNRGYLEYQNREKAEELRTKYGLDISYRDGVWYVGNEKLYEAYNVYHTGGIVGHNGTIKDNEVLSLLENGEMVLDQPKKESMYRLIDVSTYMMERFGAAVGNINGVFSSTPKLLAGNINALTRDSAGILQSITGKNPTYIIESLEVNTPIQVLQKLDENSIKEYSKTIGAISAQYIKEGFTKRGIK